MSLIAVLFIVIVVGVIVTLVNRSGMDATFKVIIWWGGVIAACALMLWYVWGIINGHTVRVW